MGGVFALRWGRIRWNLDRVFRCLFGSQSLVFPGIGKPAGAGEQNQQQRGQAQRPLPALPTGKILLTAQFPSRLGHDPAADDMAMGVTLTDTWSIPHDRLQVATFAYDHQDFIAHIMMTETTQILDAFFIDGNGAAVTSAPTLLFAREEHYRGVNLDDAAAVSVGGRTATVTASQANALPTTLATFLSKPCLL